MKFYDFDLINLNFLTIGLIYSYRFKKESKKSKVSPKESKIANSEETSKQGKKNANAFVWSEFLQTMTSKFAPKPEQNKLKRKNFNDLQIKIFLRKI